MEGDALQEQYSDDSPKRKQKPSNTQSRMKLNELNPYTFQALRHRLGHAVHLSPPLHRGVPR